MDDNDNEEDPATNTWDHRDLGEQRMALAYAARLQDMGRQRLVQRAQDFLNLESPHSTLSVIPTLPIDGTGLHTRWLHEKLRQTAQMIAADPEIVMHLVTQRPWTRRLFARKDAYVENMFEHDDQHEVGFIQSMSHIDAVRDLLREIWNFYRNRIELQDLGQHVMPALHARRLALAQAAVGDNGRAVVRRLADQLYPLPEFPWHAQSVAVLMGLHDRLGRDSGLSRLDRELLRMICEKLALF